jgi:GNAT superfamily N-acetyltransferase
MSEFSIERVTEITPEVYEAATRLAPQLGSPSQVTISEEYLQRMVDNPDYFWLMARRSEDARLIGMASLVLLPFPTNIRTALENVVVDENARLHGVGTALCEEAKKIASEQGANALRVAAVKTNDVSKRMLAKAGFPADDVVDHFELWLHRGPRF